MTIARVVGSGAPPNQMERLLLARRGISNRDSAEAAALLKGKSFQAFWSRIESSYLLGPNRAVGKSAYDYRIMFWQQLIAADFKDAKPRFNDRNPDPSNGLAKRLREISQQVPVWYGHRYSHARCWQDWKPVFREDPPPWSTR